MKHLLSLLLLLLLATQANTQSRTSLFGWEEQTKLMILDQSHNYGGMFYDRGLFRFTTPDMTKEHDLDLITYGFTTLDDYDWHYNQSNSFRSFAGSFDLGKFLLGAQNRNFIPVTDKITFPLHINRRYDMRSDRSLIMLGLDYQINENHLIGFNQTLTEQKSDLDFTAYYRYGTFQTGFIQAELGFLDWINGAIHELSEQRDKDYAEEREYLKAPFLFSLKSSSPIWNHFRAEAMAGYLSPSEARIGPKSEPEINTLDSQKAYYFGFLTEYARTSFTVALSWQTLFSEFNRINYADVFETEINNGTTQLQNTAGLFVSLKHGDFELRNWFWHAWNTDTQRDIEQRNYRGQLIYPFEYSETRLSMKNQIIYDNKSTGFISGLEWSALYRNFGGPEYFYTTQMIQSYGLPYRIYYRFVISSYEERLTYWFGWRFNSKSKLVLGVSFDVDGDREGGYTNEHVRSSFSRFDGGFGRFIVYF